MLQDAIDRARKLVENLERQQAELQTAPPALPSEKLREGKQAFDNALTSARRMLKALQEAAAIASARPPGESSSQEIDPS
jgi:hypothetical protein